MRPSNKGNGMTYDADLNLLVCEHSTSSVARFSPDGTRLASSGLDGGVRVWESETDPERYGVRRSQGSAAGGSDSGR